MILMKYGRLLTGLKRIAASTQYFVSIRWSVVEHAEQNSLTIDLFDHLAVLKIKQVLAKSSCHT